MATFTFRILSALLVYPSEGLMAAAGEFPAALDREALVPAAERQAMRRLIDEIVGGDLYDLQERYGLLFDRTRSLSLHLFEHVHGESRDRGQAMVDLLALYQKAGLAPTNAELPDFVPLFLEFLSTRQLEEARDHLAQTAHILEAIAERLKKRHSSYEAVFRALCTMAQTQPDRSTVEALLHGPDPDPNDLEALDAAWEEEEVRFGPDAQSTAACSKDGLVARMRHAKRAVPNQDAQNSGANG
ncbi:MAG: nitrate reductase molybdenum cofactor assembly chaperone [Hyphomicrobiales bacterium]|nr:nitrate reductase molybdenum cofactor assembly chaperone [Hyphomicrobiales bacterium]MDE2114979.1 nitrate reductase molybdenum cofactor assembly chaperone [Hyphomicrobiales bacterium]